jgi:hypothetical protein
MLDHIHLLIEELTALTNYPEGLTRAVQATERLLIHGEEPSICFYGHYINPDENTDYQDRSSIAYDFYQTMRRHFAICLGEYTAIEYAVQHMRPGLLLNEEQQAFLALCKEVQEGVQI